MTIEDRNHNLSERYKGSYVIFAEPARLPIDCAQCADPDARRRFKRDSQVGFDSWFVRDERVEREARIAVGIFNDKGLRCHDRMRAEGDLSRRPIGVKSDLSRKNLFIVIDKRHV